MPNPSGSRTVYLNRDQALSVEHLSSKDIFILVTKARDLFASLQMTPEAEKILAEDRELSEVIEKW